jgi:hypothetical protein
MASAGVRHNITWISGVMDEEARGLLKLLAVFAAVLAFSIPATGMFIGESSAQPDARVLDACGPEEQEIDATDLPEVVEPARCPVEGRRIVDGAVKSLVPPPGKGVYSEVLTTSGVQELDVARRADGTMELDHVGDDSQEFTAETRAVSGQGPCSDPAYTDKSWRVSSGIHYRFNTSTTPRGITHRAARNAIRSAAGNAADTRSDCHLGDQVPATLKYDGSTRAVADMKDDSCVKSDGASVISFGDLTKALAKTCTYYRINASGYDELGTSDMKLNRADFKWTVHPDSRSCTESYDIEGVATHEWGHTLGLGHVPEQTHGRLTMSPVINGPCQKSERTLGKGDVLGLEGKYP